MNILLESYRAGLFQKKHWLPNIISGVIVGFVALPLAMAFAIASGAEPVQGIYTAVIAGFFASVFGGSRLQITGPTGAFIIILAGITSKYGIEGLQVATLLAGIMLFLFGLARFGGVIKFIPDPVIVGFTAGIAIIIWVGQWSYFFGLPAATGTHFHEKLCSLIQNFPQLHMATTSLALGSLFVLIFSGYVPGVKRVPAPLLVLVLATMAQAYFHFDGVSTLGSRFGGIPQGLPSFHVPNMSLDRIIELIQPAFTIAMLGAIESLMSAVVADGMTGTRHNSNQELIGQGLANVAAPLFGGFAASGAIARTTINVRNGGNSPLAGIVHAITLLLVLLMLAPLAANVPLAALAAILFMVAWNMSGLKHIIKLFKTAPWADIAILLVTFALTVFVDLIVAVNIGVILAILHFIMRMSKSVEVRQETHAELTEAHAEEALPKDVPDDVLIYSVNGPFFFAATEHFEHTLLSTHTEPRVLIIRLRWVPFIDTSGIQTLDEVVENLQGRNTRVLLTGANKQVTARLKKAGLIKRIGEDNVFTSLKLALAAVKPEKAKKKAK
jgi:sulfate permease, SulP family